VTRAESEISDLKSQISNLKAQIERHHGKPPVAWCRHAWRGVDVIEGDGRAVRRDVEWLRGKRVVTMLGVGNPNSIKRQLESSGATIATDIPWRDHEDFGSGKVNAARDACQGCDALVVTGKDWVKLAKLIDSRQWPVPIVVPQLEIEFVAGEAELRDLI